jgi:hypothetical protein
MSFRTTFKTMFTKMFRTMFKRLELDIMSNREQIVGKSVSGETRKTGALSLWALALIGLLPETSQAADFALLLTVPAIVNQVVLIAAIASLLVAFRVYTLVKGGLLAKSWQMFVVGLLCLAIAQIFALAETAGYFSAPEWLRPMTFLCMAGLWLYGLLQARRALS